MCRSWSQTMGLLSARHDWRCSLFGIKMSKSFQWHELFWHVWGTQHFHSLTCREKQEQKQQGTSLLKIKEDRKERKHEIHFKSLEVFSCQGKDAVKGPRKTNIITPVIKAHLILLITGELQKHGFYMPAVWQFLKSCLKLKPTSPLGKRTDVPYSYRYIFLDAYSLEWRMEMAWSRVGSARFPNLHSKLLKE